MSFTNQIISIMSRLKFLYQNWSRSYYELQSEEITCWYYNDFYKTIMPKKLREEKIKDTRTWAEYAYGCNLEFMRRMWDGEFSIKDDIFNDKVDEIARIFNVVALIEATDQPYAYLDLGAMFATLCFLDEKNRVYMQYSFSNEYKKDFLFLVELEIFIYPEKMVNDSWKNKDYISYAFAPDGYLEVTKIFDVRGEGLMEKYVADQPVNVESNWEKYPDFGDWDSIFRMKRWKEGELAASAIMS